jgi:DNA invertase Pin-like site-specific DNA recombinase
MASGKWVSYLRVSTDRQGRSGLGLEAQREAVAGYLNGGRWKLISEFVEIEHGDKCDRPQLEEALRACRVHKATLIIARLDRLSRDPHFLLGLQKAGVEFVVVTMPNANRLTVGIMAMVAEEELRAIRERTRGALAAVKARGKSLGGRRYKFVRDAAGKIVKDEDGKPVVSDQIANGSVEAREAAVRATRERAAQKAADIGPTIRKLQAGGATSLRAIAAGLNEQGIPTSRDAGAWNAMQVSRVLARL